MGSPEEQPRRRQVRPRVDGSCDPHGGGPRRQQVRPRVDGSCDPHGGGPGKILKKDVRGGHVSQNATFFCTAHCAQQLLRFGGPTAKDRKPLFCRASVRSAHCAQQLLRFGGPPAKDRRPLFCQASVRSAHCAQQLLRFGSPTDSGLYNTKLESDKASAERGGQCESCLTSGSEF